MRSTEVTTKMDDLNLSLEKIQRQKAILLWSYLKEHLDDGSSNETLKKDVEKFLNGSSDSERADIYLNLVFIIMGWMSETKSGSSSSVKRRSSKVSNIDNKMKTKKPPADVFDCATSLFFDDF